MDSLYVLNIEDDTLEQLYASDHSLWPSSWSENGRYLAFVELHSDTQQDILLYDFKTPGPPRPFVNSTYREYNPMFSPDGEWIAYVSTESGGREVYLRDTERTGPTIQVTSDGGAEPMWAPDGGRLFYRRGDAMMAVRFDKASGSLLGPSEELFVRETSPRISEYSSRYDVIGDSGSDEVRFLMIDEPEGAAKITELTLVSNWLGDQRPADRP